MQHHIHECIANFGRAPRRFSCWDRWTYLRLRRPAWLRDNPRDASNTTYRFAAKTYREGVVVWGHVIQANSMIWKAGRHDHGGEVVYSLNDPTKVPTQFLESLAGRLYALKNTSPDAAGLAEIANYLTNELIRVFGLAVPTQLSPHLPCLISTTMFPRKHLPRKRLCSGLLPIVVHPEPPYVALPLPARYWPRELVDEWVD